jgi:hypothetical protein
MEILKIGSNSYKISDLSFISRVISEAEKANEKNVEIIIAEGNYFIENSIKINAANLSVKIKAEGKVRLIGGKKLSNITHVTDKEIYTEWVNYISK